LQGSGPVNQELIQVKIRDLPIAAPAAAEVEPEPAS